jgi:hypothetical protein
MSMQSEKQLTKRYQALARNNHKRIYYTSAHKKE